MTSKDRAIRLEAHKLHAIALLASTGIRNRWCSNLLLKVSYSVRPCLLLMLKLQARLLSLLPHPLQAAFVIPPSRFPDRAQRSRLFFDALQSLVTWWSQSFFDVSETTLGLRTRPWDDVQEIVDQLPRLTKADFRSDGAIGGKGKEKAEEDADKMERLNQIFGGERLRSANSMMKKVLQQEGSRDISAQLFVALARACGLGARLVTSLQVVPWRAEKVVVKKKSGGSGKRGRTVASRQGIGSEAEEDEDDMEEVPIPNDDSEPSTPGKVKGKKENVRAGGKRRLQDPADLYRLRKPKPELQKVGTVKPKKKIKEGKL